MDLIRIGSFLAEGGGVGTTTSSVMVFHAPQEGHRPSQRILVSPHSLHT